MDRCVHSRADSPRGERYFMLVIYYYSILTWASFLRNKSYALEKFKVLKLLEENQTYNKIKCILSDKGEKFTSDEFADLCDEHGIMRKYTITETP